MADAISRHFVSALARGLEILRCFDRPRIELSVSQIARRTGLSQPTAWRLCQTLLDCGYLVRSATGAGLRVGAPALTLGYAAVRGMSQPELVAPYMQRITAATGAGTTLMLRRGLEVIAVEQCHGTYTQINQPIGWRAPLASVSSGLAILAGLTPAAREATMAELAGTDPAWPRHRARIETAVAALDRDGFVRLDGMLDGQFLAIAVPLFEPGSDPAEQWALSCGEVTGRWSEADIAAAAGELIAVAALLRPALAVF